MSQFCFNCGTKLPDDAMFCSECGTKVKSAETFTQPANTENIVSVQPIVAPVSSGMESVPYVSPVEPPKAEEPMTYVSAVEPPKAEEPVTYVSAVEPPKAEEPMTYVSPIEPPMPENSASYTGGNSYYGGMQNQTPVTSVPPMIQDQPIPGFGAPGAKQNKKDKPKKKKKGLLAFLVIVLLLGSGAGAVWFLDFNGTIDVLPKKETESTYKDAIDLYVEGIEKQKTDTFLDAYASFLLEEFVDGEGEEFMEEVYEEYESEVGEGISIKYEVTKEKEYSESKLEKLQKELEEDYDFKGTIEKAYDITTKFTIKGEDDETDDKVKFLVVQIKGQWYLAEFDN